MRLGVLLVLTVLGTLALPAATGSAGEFCNGHTVTRVGTAGADMIIGTADGMGSSRSAATT